MASNSSWEMARGKLTVMRVPWPRALSTSMLPLCRSTNALVSGNPKSGAFVAAFQPVIDLGERLEGHVHIFRGHADARVADGDGDRVGCFLRYPAKWCRRLR